MNNFKVETFTVCTRNIENYGRVIIYSIVYRGNMNCHRQTTTNLTFLTFLMAFKLQLELLDHILVYHQHSVIE